jgi:hypothetical protein
MNMNEIRQRLREPNTRAQAAIEFGDWFRDLCLMFDCEVETACNVGAAIAMGLDKEFAERESNETEATP